MKYPPFSWLRLSDDFHPSPNRVWLSFSGLPKPQELCHVRLHIGGSKVSITDPFEAIKLNNIFLAREKKVLELFLKIAKPMKTKTDFTIDHTSFATLLPYVSLIPFEISGEGVLILHKEPATIKTILKNDDKDITTAIEFILCDSNNQVINNPIFYGDVNTYVIDDKLKLYSINPNITQNQVETILSCPPLYLSGLLNQQSRNIFYTLSRIGFDFSALEHIAVKPKNSQIILRLILTLDDISKKMCARVHLVTEISNDNFADETEIKSLGFIPKYHVAADMNYNEERFNEEIFLPQLLKRPYENEIKARDFLYHLGASPARLHDGFLLYGEQALNLLKSISFEGGLPSFIKLDDNAKPNIIELNNKIKLIISADEDTPKRVDISISLSKQFDQTNTEFNIILNSKESLVVIDSDTLVIINDEIKNILKYLCDTLSLTNPKDKKNKSVAQIVLLINSFADNIVVEAEPSLLSFLYNFSIKENDSDRIMPHGLKTNLRSYQVDAVAWLSALNRSGLGGLLGDEMGLGKTLMILTHLAKLKEHNPQMNPVLVVSPTSVLDVWIDEAKHHLPNLKVMKWHGSERSVNDINNFDIVVTSYAVLRRDYNTKLKAIRFATLVLDEAQYVRNQQTDSFKAAKSITSDHKIALTGTPIENHLSDLYNILDCVEDGILGPRSIFDRQFVNPIDSGDFSSVTKLKMLISPVVLRRRKAEVENELPAKIENLVHCVLNHKQRELYNQYLQSMSNSIVNALSKTSTKSEGHFSLLSVLTRLRQICCHPSLILGDDKSYSSGKLDSLKEIIEQCLESGRKMIIYSQFLKMQEHIVNLAHQLHHKGALWLHGSSKNRDEIIKSFQDNNGPSIIVVSLKAGGTGITLTAADTVIFADPWWNPAVEDQAVDRAHRIGQKKTVHVIRIIADNSIESEVLSLAQKKRQAAMSVLHEGFKTSSSLTQDDIKNLLLREVDRIAKYNSDKDDELETIEEIF